MKWVKGFFLKIFKYLLFSATMSFTLYVLSGNSSIPVSESISSKINEVKHSLITKNLENEMKKRGLGSLTQERLLKVFEDNKHKDISEIIKAAQTEIASLQKDDPSLKNTMDLLKNNDGSSSKLQNQINNHYKQAQEASHH